jgi:hypothetical protein
VTQLMLKRLTDIRIEDVCSVDCISTLAAAEESGCSSNVKSDAMLEICMQEHQSTSDPRLTTDSRADRTCTSLADLKSAIIDCDIDFGSFIYVKSNTLLTFVLLSDDRNTVVKLSVVVGDNFVVFICVFGNEVLRTRAIFHESAATVSSANSVALLLKCVLTFVVCEALHCAELPSTLSLSDLRGSKDQTDKRLRSTNCHLLINSGTICASCKLLRKRAVMTGIRRRRLLTTSNMASPVKLQKLMRLAR